MGELLHDHSLELAKMRLERSTDPFAIVQAALALKTGTLPDPAEVGRIAKQIQTRMDLAPISGRHPDDILGLVALDAQLDLISLDTTDPSS
jgi:hypothetical protein